MKRNFALFTLVIVLCSFTASEHFLLKTTPVGETPVFMFANPATGYEVVNTFQYELDASESYAARMQSILNSADAMGFDYDALATRDCKHVSLIKYPSVKMAKKGHPHRLGEKYIYLFSEPAVKYEVVEAMTFPQNISKDHTYHHFVREFTQWLNTLNNKDFQGVILDGKQGVQLVRFR